MIPKEFILTKHLSTKFEEYIAGIPPEDFYAIEENLINKDTGNLWKYDLCKTFEDDYNYYTKKDIFFIGCNLESYIEHYNIRLSEYLSNLPDGLEIDFIIRDFNQLHKGNPFSFASENLKEKIKTSIRREKEFLEVKVDELKYIIYSSNDRWGNITYHYSKINPSSSNEVSIDLSETSITDKIIYLQLLGILDCIKTKANYGYSINKIATILSAITGDKPQTIQSFINPINNPTADQKNNPMTKDNNVSKVRNKLIDLGFTVD